MSGRRGFISQEESIRIERARRVLNHVRNDSHADYKHAVSEFVSDVYGCLRVAQPKLYLFSSPLACMLALPRIIAIHSSGIPAYLLTDLASPLTTLRSRGSTDRDENLASAVSQGINAVTAEETVSDIFKETFVREMKEQCTGTEKEFRDMTKSLRHLGGKEWWTSTGSGGTWIWPYNEFVVASNRPIRTAFDDRGRPHGQDDAAIEFGDSYRVWTWHGVVVPKEVILFPEALSFTNVEKERNVEVRRIMIERIGHGKYLKQAEAVLVDMDTLTLDGSAPRALMKDKLGNMWLVGTDGSTARVYTMAVPPDVKTCREAHEMICGFEESRLIAEA